MFEPFQKQLTKVTDLTILFATIFVFLAYITPEGISESTINSVRSNSQTIASSLAIAETQSANANAKTQRLNLISNDLRSSIIELEMEVDKIIQEIDATDQTRIDQLNAEINQLNTELTNNIIQEIDATDQEIDGTDQTRIDQLNAEINQLNIELTNNIIQEIDATDQTRIDQLNAEINQLNTELTNNESEISTAQTALETANQNVQLLRANLSSAQQEVAELEAALESSRAISWIQPVRQNTDKLIDAAGFDGFIAGFAALIFCLVCKRRQTWFKQMFGIYFK